MKQQSKAVRGPEPKSFKLRPHDRGKLERILQEKAQSDSRRYQRALILIQLAEGCGITAIAKNLRISLTTVQTRREFYLSSGLERALSDAEGRGRKPEILAEQEQQIVAIACTEPPLGASHWSSRLLAIEAKKRNIIKAISPRAVLIILQRHELKPWREKNVVRRGAG